MLDGGGRLYLGGAFGSVDGTVRRGLARLEADDTLSAWDPDLLTVLRWSSVGGLDELTPRSMVVLGDNLVVGGCFTALEPNPRGGWFGNRISPLLVFSVSSGTLVRPTDPERWAWFTTNQAVGYSMVATDGGLAVALGVSGMAVFDATTLDLDETASSTYMEQVWQMVDVGNGVYALAVPGGGVTAGAAAAGLGTAQTATTALTATTPKPLIIAGLIPRWQYRVAGNVVRTTVGADTRAPVASSVRVVPRTSREASSTGVPVRATSSR
jgi:hypothetical protein